MTKQQRQQRATLFLEQPFLWLFIIYAACFFGGAVTSDILGVAARDVGLRYLLPLLIAVVLWRMFRKGAQQIVASP